MNLMYMYANCKRCWYLLWVKKPTLLHEFAWHNLIDDLVEEHAMTVLKTSDVRVTKDSKALLRIAAVYVYVLIL